MGVLLHRLNTRNLSMDACQSQCSEDTESLSVFTEMNGRFISMQQDIPGVKYDGEIKQYEECKQATGFGTYLTAGLRLC